MIQENQLVQIGPDVDILNTPLIPKDVIQQSVFLRSTKPDSYETYTYRIFLTDEQEQKIIEEFKKNTSVHQDHEIVFIHPQIEIRKKL